MTKRLLKTAILAKDGTLYAPKSFKDASYYELNLVCNGCGAADAKFDFIPDRIYGTYIGHACHIHDWMYDQGATAQDKIVADDWFFENLKSLIDREKAWYKPKILMKWRAKKYYLAVKKFGDGAYWKGKEPLV